MERLTEMIGDFVVLKKCAETRCVEICDECVVEEEAKKKLKEYEDAEEQGLLLRLPCKVGDKYYRIHCFCSMCGYENKETFHPTRSDCELWCEYNHKNPCDKEYRIVEYTFECLETIINNAKDIGTSLFLTREEAEKALAEMG